MNDRGLELLETRNQFVIFIKLVNEVSSKLNEYVHVKLKWID